MFNLLWKDNRTQVTVLRAADRINPKEQGKVSHALPAAFMDKGRGRIESERDCGYWSTSTQSCVPSACAVLGVVKLWEPLWANGEPGIAVELPVVGSYQEAVISFEKFAILTESVVETGVYVMASVPLVFQEVVA